MSVDNNIGRQIWITGSGSSDNNFGNTQNKNNNNNFDNNNKYTLDKSIYEYNTPNSLLLKGFYVKFSNKVNKKCSNNCGFKVFEEFLCGGNKDPSILPNYQDTLNCYEKCLSKHYMSSYIAVNVLYDKLL